MCGEMDTMEKDGIPCQGNLPEFFRNADGNEKLQSEYLVPWPSHKQPPPEYKTDIQPVRYPVPLLLKYQLLILSTPDSPYDIYFSTDISEHSPLLSNILDYITQFSKGL